MADVHVSWWKRAFKILFKGLCIAAVLIAASYAVLSWMAVRKEKAVMALWSQAGRPLDTFLASLPVTEPNDTAKALDGLAEKLGLGKADKTGPWKSVAEPLGNYLKEALEKTAGPGMPPPEAVAKFLRDQAPVIAGVRRLLLENPPPVWKQTNKGFADASLPNLLQTLNLEKVLATDALAAVSRGERDLALEDLDAGWRLCDALNKRPELISALVTIAMVRMPVGVLRFVDDVPAKWQDRLKAYVPRSGLGRAYQFEACFLFEMARTGTADWAFGSKPTWIQRFVAMLSRPYVRLCLADGARIELEMVKAAEASGPCPEGLEAEMSDILAHAPGWNFIARIALPNLSSSWGRAYRMQLDLEMTGKILLAEAARRKDGPAWPEAVPGIESSICPKGKWIYARTPAGASIQCDRPPRFPDAQKGIVLPLHFEFPAAPATGVSKKR